MKLSKRILLKITVGLLQAFILAFSGCITDPPPPPTVTDALSVNVPVVIQQTPEWCWAASAQMIFQHYDLPSLNPNDFQCGIVAAYFGPNSSCWINCYSCIVGISTASEFQNLIDNYGYVARQLGVNSRVLTSSLNFGPLTIAEIATEIKNNRIIFAGISPTGFALPNLSAHAVVIVGYDATGSAAKVIVNDPWPYDLPVFGSVVNPYLANGGAEISPGQYSLSLDSFITALQWANTLYQIQ